MTDRPPQLSDAAVERMLGRRAPRGADVALLVEIVDVAGQTRQRRAWWPPLGSARLGPRVVLVWVALALVAALTVGALVAGGFGRDRSDLSVIVPPLPTGSPRTGLPTPTVGPSSSPSPHPEATGTADPCASVNVRVATGDAMTSATPSVSFAGADAVTGAFVTQDGGDFYGTPITAAIWSTDGPGTTHRIATVDGAAIDHVAVEDLSSDGMAALVMVASTFDQGGPVRCADLYLVRTDGSGASLLAQFRTADSFPSPTLSPDGRKVAYGHSDHGLAVVVLDLATGQQWVQDGDCAPSDGSLFWSPDSRRLLVGCTHSLVIVEPGTAAPSPIQIVDGSWYEAASWEDQGHLILAMSTPDRRAVDLIRYDVENRQGTTIGRAEMPDGATATGSSGFYPDLKRIEVTYMVEHDPLGFGRPWTDTYDIHGRVIGPGLVTDKPGARWSTDGRSIVFVRTYDLLRLDLDDPHPYPLGRLPGDYYDGIWRIP